MSRLTRSEIETMFDDLILAHPIYTPQLRALREQSLSQEAVRNEALDLGQFVNAASIGGGDSPHQVVEKLQRAINAAALKREPNAAAQVDGLARRWVDHPDRPAPAAPDVELTDEIAAIVHGLAEQQAMQDDWWRPRLDAVIAALRRGPERPVTVYSHLTQEQFDQLQSDAMSWRTRPSSGEMVMVPRDLTPAMHEAGLRFAGTLHANYEDCWKALLSAAEASKEAK